tara:strand:- start:1647 stop:1832 length:186 start_codon:yes stop_codon:yes gene_type:complete
MKYSKEEIKERYYRSQAIKQAKKEAYYSEGKNDRTKEILDYYNGNSRIDIRTITNEYNQFN